MTNNAALPTAIGIDIGGTQIRAGLIDAAGRPAELEHAPTPPNGEPNALATTIIELMRRLSAKVSGCPAPPGWGTDLNAELASRPQVIGVALPGIRDETGDIMRLAVNLRALEGVNVRELLESALNRPILLETDVNAAAFAQWRALDPRPERFVYLSLGTGVGGAAILRGRIIRHTDGGAGHFGFLVVDTAPEAPLDNAGVRGSLSAFVSGPAFDAGDDEFRRSAAPRALATALRQIASIYAPEAIAIGGGLADAHPELIEAARQRFADRADTLLHSPARIERAALPSDEAGVIGAGLLALEA